MIEREELAVVLLRIREGGEGCGRADHGSVTQDGRYYACAGCLKLVVEAARRLDAKAYEVGRALAGVGNALDDLRVSRTDAAGRELHPKQRVLMLWPRVLVEEGDMLRRADGTWWILRDGEVCRASRDHE